MELTNIRDGRYYTCYMQRDHGCYAFPTFVYSTLCLELAVADALRRHGCEVLKTSEYRDNMAELQNAGADLLVKIGAARYVVDVKRCSRESMHGEVPFGCVKEAYTDLVATVIEGFVYLARPVDLEKYKRANAYGSHSVSAADFVRASAELNSCDIFPMQLSGIAVRLLDLGRRTILSRRIRDYYGKYDPATQWNELDGMLRQTVVQSEFARGFADMLGVEPEIIAV